MRKGRLPPTQNCPSPAHPQRAPRGLLVRLNAGLGPSSRGDVSLKAPFAVSSHPGGAGNLADVPRPRPVLLPREDGGPFLLRPFTEASRAQVQQGDGIRL